MPVTCINNTVLKSFRLTKNCSDYRIYKNLSIFIQLYAFILLILNRYIGCNKVEGVMCFVFFFNLSSSVLRVKFHYYLNQ